MHQQGEGICQKGLLWSQKHLTACEMIVKEIKVQVKRTNAEVDLTLLTLEVSKK